MPANPKPRTLWYMPGICKDPSSLTWLIDCQKTGICGAYVLVQKSIDSYITAKSWHTSGTHHHEWPNVNADGEFFRWDIG